MVGISEEVGKLRLTWFVNMDFGGLIPSSFANGALLSLMACPLAVARDAERLALENGMQKGESDDLNSITSSSPLESATELKLKAELVEIKAEMARKDEELRNKDRALAGKVEELKEDASMIVALQTQSKLAASVGEKEVELNGAVLDTERDNNVAKEKLKAELADVKAEMAKKDEELKMMKAEVQELRRRLPRS